MLEVGMFLVDRYEILAKIGAGGMADVYKAKDHFLGRVVAIKALKPEFSEDVSFVTKFRTEAQSAAGLEHPNIVNIYDVGSENGLHFIVMEHIEGITLKTYIEKKGQLSFKEATSIAIQVARGIEAAHNKEIIHRDIKPQNIIISTEGKVKVTDFGIARASSSNTISADVMGSVHYASPEQTRNGYVDGRSDIYSLGIVMYEMVTGRVPFDGDTTVAVALQHLQEEMVGPSVYAPELPISYEKIVLKCTQKNPDRRYQDIYELLADLRKALVTPDEDFVVLTPLPEATKTRIIGGNELEEIQNGALDVDLDQETRFANEEDYEEVEPDDEYDEEDDEEDAGFLNPKVEKALTYVGIAVLALILGLIVYFVVLIANLGNRGNNPNTQPSQSQTQSESETDSETETDSNTENMVEMIDITGMTVEEAEEALEKLGLEIFVGASKESTKEDGTILEQNVDKGEMVEKGQTITVVIAGENTSQQMVAVPDVTTLSEADAIKMLTKNNFLYERKYEYSNEVEKGYVISQTPEYGEKVKPGSRITIVISDGPENLAVPTMNTLKNKTLKEITKTLEELGFVVNTIEEYNSEYKEGVVFKIPNAGKEVKYGSTIDVYVSKGAEPVISYKYEKTFVYDGTENPDEIASYAYTYQLYDANGKLLIQKSGEGKEFTISRDGMSTSEGQVNITWTIEVYSVDSDEDGIKDKDAVAEVKDPYIEAVSFEKVVGVPSTGNTEDDSSEASTDSQSDSQTGSQSDSQSDSQNSSQSESQD